MERYLAQESPMDVIFIGFSGFGVSLVDNFVTMMIFHFNNYFFLN